jgi:hypothetical protein
MGEELNKRLLKERTAPYRQSGRITSDECFFKREDDPCSGEVLVYPARTCYPWDGKGEDPNAPRAMCSRHAEEYHSYWDEMWAEFFWDKL